MPIIICTDFLERNYILMEKIYNLRTWAKNVLKAEIHTWG